MIRTLLDGRLAWGFASVLGLMLLMVANLVAWGSPRPHLQPITTSGIIIHELMADPTPAVGLPAVEWIELRNTGEASVMLQGWRLADAGSVSGPLPAITLLPDSFLIVCSAGSVASLSVFGRCVSVSSFPSLDNASDVLSIRDGSGQVVHAVAYSDSWHESAVKRDGGWSLEMRDTRFPCYGLANWASSIHALGGTPGKANSVADTLARQSSPAFLRATVADRHTVMLWCSGWVDGLVNLDSTRYWVDGVHPIQVRVIPPLNKQIALTVLGPLDSGRIYEVRVVGLVGCDGIVGRPTSRPTAIAANPTTQRIRISEVLFHPPAGGSDYLELWHDGDAPIDVGELFVANRTSAGQVAPPVRLSAEPWLWFPRTYLVVTADTAWLQRRYPSIDSTALLLPVDLPAMNNDAGQVLVLPANGQALDELVYDEGWHFRLLRNRAGIALERIEAIGPTNDPANWHSAAQPDFGTPGRRNSQQQIEAERTGWSWLSSSVVTPDFDGVDDVLLVHYALPGSGFMARIALYDLSGRLLFWILPQGLCGRSGFFKWDGLGNKQERLATGTYLLWIECISIDGRVLRKKHLVSVGYRS